MQLPSIIKSIFSYIPIIVVSLSSCTFSINREKLNGTWKYSSMKHLNPASDDTITAEQMLGQKPYIRFTEKDELSIVWGGKVLSQGTFRMDGKMIRFKEALPGGTFREFPFLISKLTDTELVFETMVREGTRVVARKE